MMVVEMKRRAEMEAFGPGDDRFEPGHEGVQPPAPSGNPRTARAEARWWQFFCVSHA